MTVWILIIIFHGSHDPETMKLSGFTSFAQCQKTADYIWKKEKAGPPKYGSVQTLLCVPVEKGVQ